MKGFVIVLLCALATVEPRYTGVSENAGVRAALGDNPSVVHHRIAIGTSGLLNTGAGTLISDRWVLTTASNVADARFIWNRLGVVNVVNPSLVIESARVFTYPGYDASTGANNIALLDLNRIVQPSENIAPAKLSADSETPTSGTVCVFGATESGEPGETLTCSGPADAAVSKSDSGAGLYNENGELSAVLTGTDGEAQFTPVADYLDWIEEQTGLSLS